MNSDCGVLHWNTRDSRTKGSLHNPPNTRNDDAQRLMRRAVDSSVVFFEGASNVGLTKKDKAPDTDGKREKASWGGAIDHG